MIYPADLPEPVNGLGAGECFNYTWISILLDQMLEEVEDQCRKDGIEAHWHVFQARVLLPIMENTKPPSLAQVCDSYGIEDGTKASNMIVTVKRRFQAALKRHLRLSVSSDADVNNELRELMQFFVKNSAR